MAEPMWSSSWPFSNWLASCGFMVSVNFIVKLIQYIHNEHTSMQTGLQNFCDDIEFMCNRRVSLYWRVCWSFFTPVMMIIIFIYSMVTIEPIKYSELYFPEAANSE